MGVSTVRIVAVIIGAVASALTVVLLIHNFVNPLQWGTVAEWSAATGSVGAFIAGVGVIGRDNHLRRLQEERRHRELQKHQARNITGWWNRVDGEIELLNASRGVVYEVLVTVEFDVRNHRDAQLLQEESTIRHRIQALPPGRATVAQSPPYGPEQEVAWRLFFEFTDQANMHWRRGPSGELTQTDDTPFDREYANNLPTTYSDVKIFRVGHIA
jgi:hypothetical protein